MLSISSVCLFAGFLLESSTVHTVHARLEHPGLARARKPARIWKPSSTALVKMLPTGPAPAVRAFVVLGPPVLPVPGLETAAEAKREGLECPSLRGRLRLDRATQVKTVIMPAEPKQLQGDGGGRGPASTFSLCHWGLCQALHSKFRVEKRREHGGTRITARENLPAGRQSRKAVEP